MKRIFFLIILFNLFYNYQAFSLESYVVLKVNNKIITNIDINNEYRYLIALSPELQKVDKKKFPSIKLIKKCLNFGYATPIIINASNEVLVDLFLREKINFLDIVAIINKIFKDKDFSKYARRKPKTVKEIKIIDNWARLKTTNMCVI